MSKKAKVYDMSPITIVVCGTPHQVQHRMGDTLNEIVRTAWWLDNRIPAEFDWSQMELTGEDGRRHVRTEGGGFFLDETLYLNFKAGISA